MGKRNIKTAPPAAVKLFLSPHLCCHHCANNKQLWFILLFVFAVFFFKKSGDVEVAHHCHCYKLMFWRRGDQWESFIFNNLAPWPSCCCILAKKSKEFNFEPLWFLGQPPQLKCEVTCWQRVVSGVRRGRGGLGKYIWMNIDISLAPCGG